MSVMLEKVGQAAERAATRVARRAFLGKLGQRAIVFAGALGALFALPGEAEAAGGCCCGTISDDPYCYRPAKGRKCGPNERRCNCNRFPCALG